MQISKSTFIGGARVEKQGSGQYSVYFETGSLPEDTLVCNHMFFDNEGQARDMARKVQARVGGYVALRNGFHTIAMFGPEGWEKP